jgi:hypothetical protein
MNRVLTDCQQLEPELPLTWAPILEDLKRFEALYENLGRGAAPAAAQPLLDLHTRLLELAEGLHEPGEDLSPERWNEVFATALMMATRLEAATLFDRPILDTFGSKTLSLFQVDWKGPAAEVEGLRRLIETCFGVKAQRLALIEAEIDERLADARRKARLVDALREAFELSPDNPELRLAIKRLVWFLYPDCQLAEDEIELVVVGTAVFVCIPFSKEDLQTDRFRRMSEDEKRPVRAFLRRVNQFRPVQFQNFPVFGFLDGKDLDESWIQDIAELAGLTAAQTRDELSRLVAILPLDDVDKFIVHDVWGHVWQAAMLDFEKMYQELGRYSERLDLQESALSAQGSSMKLLETIERSEAGAKLNHERFRSFVLTEVAERVPVSYSAIIAEMVADVVEYKFLVQNPAHFAAMPNSSYFKSCPTKLDLLIEDLGLYFEQTQLAFKASLEDELGANAFRQSMVREGISEQDAAKIHSEMLAVWQSLLSKELLPEMAWSTVDGRLHVNLYARLALTFLSFHRAVVKTCNRLDSLDLSGTPFGGLYDLMCLAVSLFFEEDRRRNLWRLDEYLEDGFVEACQKVLSAWPKHRPGSCGCAI